MSPHYGPMTNTANPPNWSEEVIGDLVACMAATRAWQKSNAAMIQVPKTTQLRTHGPSPSGSSNASSLSSLSSGYCTASEGEMEAVSPRQSLANLDQCALGSRRQILAPPLPTDTDTLLPLEIEKAKTRTDSISPRQEFLLFHEQVQAEERVAWEKLKSQAEGPMRKPEPQYDYDSISKGNFLRNRIQRQLQSTEPSELATIDLDHEEFALVNNAGRQCKRTRPNPPASSPTTWCNFCGTRLEGCSNSTFLRHDVDVFNRKFVPSYKQSNRQVGPFSTSQPVLSRTRTRRRTVVARRDSSMLQPLLQ